MDTIRRILAPKEVKIALNVLDELSLEFNSEAFKIVRNRVEDAIIRNCKNIVNQVKDGATPRELVYFSIANIAGDYIESGDYHIYRGVLNTLGPGPDFLILFDAAVDRLVEIGSVDKKEAEEQKTGIRENIKSVG